MLVGASGSERGEEIKVDTMPEWKGAAAAQSSGWSSGSGGLGCDGRKGRHLGIKSAVEEGVRQLLPSV